MKIFHFAFTGSCNNEMSYIFDQMPSVVLCNENELKTTFSSLKKEFLKSFEKIKKSNIKSYENYKFGLTITVIYPALQKARFKNIYINPLNLKQKKD